MVRKLAVLISLFVAPQPYLNASSQSDLVAFGSYFAQDVAQYFASNEQIYLSPETQNALAQQFATSLSSERGKSELVIDDQAQVTLHLQVLKEPQDEFNSGDEMAKNLERVLPEWYNASRELFILQEARKLLEKEVEDMSIPEQVENLLPVIRAEVGTAMAPYIVSNVTVNQLPTENKHYELVVECKEPSIYDKAMYVQTMLINISEAYNKVFAGTAVGDGELPEGYDEVITLLKRANGVLKYSEPAQKHIAALTHLAAHAFDKANVWHIAQELHATLFAEFGALLQEEVLPNVRTIAQLEDVQNALAQSSDVRLTRAGLLGGEGTIQTPALFAQEELGSFEGNLEKALTFISAELASLEEGVPVLN